MFYIGIGVRKFKILLHENIKCENCSKTLIVF